MPRSPSAPAPPSPATLASDHEEQALALQFEALLRHGELDAAEQVIRQLLREHPAHAHYHGRLAALQLARLEIAAARDSAQQGCRHDRSDAQCCTALQLADLLERPSAHWDVAPILERHPQALHTLVLIVIALQSRGDMDGAQALSRQLARLQPDNAVVQDMARELDSANHWSLIPLRPLQRLGWLSCAVLGVLAYLLLDLLARTHFSLALMLAILVIIYCIYSWIWPAILKRLLRT